MKNIDVVVSPTGEGGRMPTYGTEASAGADLYSNEDVVFLPGQIHPVALGIKMHIPEGFHGRIESRSSMALKGMIVLTGVIDEDYRGELKAIIMFAGPNNHNGYAERFEIKKGDRIAQLVFRPTVQAEFAVGDVTGDTARGAGGFGSTGTR